MAFRVVTKAVGGIVSLNGIANLHVGYAPPPPPRPPTVGSTLTTQQVEARIDALTALIELRREQLAAPNRAMRVGTYLAILGMVGALSRLTPDTLAPVRGATAFAGLACSLGAIAVQIYAYVLRRRALRVIAVAERAIGPTL